MTVTRDPSIKLAARGRRLWVDLAAGEPTPAERVLIEEACRIADRLDKLDAQLRGDEDAWLTLAGRDDETELTVVVDKALSEARQQAVALKQLIGELRQSRAPAKTPASARQGSTPAADAAAQPEMGVVPDGVADLGARIRQRSAQAAR